MYFSTLFDLLLFSRVEFFIHLDTCFAHSSHFIVKKIAAGIFVYFFHYLHSKRNKRSARAAIPNEYKPTYQIEPKKLIWKYV